MKNVIKVGHPERI